MKASSYLIYLPVVIVLTWDVAHTLIKNSKVFMMDTYNGRIDIAIAASKLFETGFYLLNPGLSLKIMEVATE